MRGTTTKSCKNCGKILWNVSSSTRYCAKCAAEKKKERQKRENEKRKSLKEKGRPKGTAHTRGEYAKKGSELYPKTRTKSIAQCVREAEQLGLTYGMYVAHCYDKE